MLFKKVSRMLSVLILMCMICGILFSKTMFAISVEAESWKPLVCDATIDDEFSDNIVLISPLPEWNDKLYNISDFSAIDCMSVERIVAGERRDAPSSVYRIVLSQHSKQNVLDVIQILQQRGDLYCAEPSYYIESTAVPSDPMYVDGTQWGLNKISMPDAWDINTGSSSIKVGVIDFGIDASHPDLHGCVDSQLSRSFSSAYPNPLEDVDGHGTHIAGIIGAQTNNNAGISGVCWNVSLVSLGVTSAEYPTKDYDLNAIIEAIDYASQNGIPILNLSGGIYTYSSALRIAIACYPGLFVAAAGNGNKNIDTVPTYPASYDLDNILAVGASTEIDRGCYINEILGTNYGANSVDIFAPGNNILSTYLDNGYASMSGTSMAAPFVAGVAALLLSENPDMTYGELKAAIIGHADNVYAYNGISVFEGYCVSGGRLNAAAAFEHAESLDETVSDTESVHYCSCAICGISRPEAHRWEQIGARYRCTVCGRITY